MTLWSCCDPLELLIRAPPLSSGWAEMLVSRTPLTCTWPWMYTAHTHSRPIEYPKHPKRPGHRQTRTQVSPGSHVPTCHPLCSKQSLQYPPPPPHSACCRLSDACCCVRPSGGPQAGSSPPPALCPRPAPVPSPHIHPRWTCGRRRTVPTGGGGAASFSNPGGGRVRQMPPLTHLPVQRPTRGRVLPQALPPTKSTHS